MTDKQLLDKLESLKNTMVSVSTGRQLIDQVNPDYQSNYSEVDRELRLRSITNPNSYSDLWQWYERWSSGDLPTYRSRRQFLAELFAPVLHQVRSRATGIVSEPPPATGWPRVDRTVGEIRMRLAEASNEEARLHAKAALKLALALQHRRTADFRQAAMCVEASTAVINVVAITSGRRDPADDV